MISVRGGAAGGAGLALGIASNTVRHFLHRTFE
jgi:hypothetical protein